MLLYPLIKVIWCIAEEERTEGRGLQRVNGVRIFMLKIRLRHTSVGEQMNMLGS